MKVYSIEKPNCGVLKHIDVPNIMSDEILIQVKASGICGTDFHMYNGGFEAKYPVVPGHEFAGEVIGVGSACTRFSVGDRVAVEPNIPCNNCDMCLEGNHHHCTHMIVPGVNCQGGMAEYVAVQEMSAFSIGSIPFEVGAMMEPLSCVLHGQKQLALNQGDRVLILGGGPIGQLHGQLSFIHGATYVDFIEINVARRESLTTLGKTFSSVQEVVHSYDAVIDATGIPSLIHQAQHVLKPMGKILLFGVPHQGSELVLDSYLCFRNELKIIGSYTSLKNSKRAILLLDSEHISIDNLITDRIKIDELGQVFSQNERFEDSLKIMVTF